MTSLKALLTASCLLAGFLANQAAAGDFYSGYRKVVQNHYANRYYHVHKPTRHEVVNYVEPASCYKTSCYQYRVLYFDCHRDDWRSAGTYDSLCRAKSKAASLEHYGYDVHIKKVHVSFSSH